LAPPETVFKVFIAPRENADEYKAEVDISGLVRIDGIGNIRKTIDSSDFGIGVYQYDDIKLTAQDKEGFLSDEHDVRGIFKYSRDRAKVRIVMVQRIKNNQNEIISEVETNIFRGFINEISTRSNMVDDSVTFKILSFDSVIRDTTVPLGSLLDGVTLESTLNILLNKAPITDTLTYLASNINPDAAINIDVSESLEGLGTREAINELMLGSNSVMIINSSDEIIVQNRTENTTKPILELFGRGERHSRENIVDISDYNTGLHRMFTSVTLNGAVFESSTFGDRYGRRKKKITLDWMTNSANIELAGAAVLDEFKTPKRELNVDISLALGKDVDLLDRVTINFPKEITPFDNEGEIPEYDAGFTYNQSDIVYPRAVNVIEIFPEVLFKVIEVIHNPGTYLTRLKLREAGKDFLDEVS